MVRQFNEQSGRVSVWPVVGCVAVVIILAALSLPVLQILERTDGGGASLSVCANNLKNLAAALLMYADDNNGGLPCSLLRDPKATVPDVRFCTQLGEIPPPPKPGRTYCELLFPYK